MRHGLIKLHGQSVAMVLSSLRLLIQKERKSQVQKALQEIAVLCQLSIASSRKIFR